MRTVHSIYRYPVKGLSAQPVPRVTVEPGKPFPFDRVFALVRPGAAIAVEAPQWAKKGMFLMLMLEHHLAVTETYLDPETLRLVVRSRAGAATDGDPAFETVLDVDLSTNAGREAVELYFHQLLPGLAAAPRLVHSADGHFMDKPDNVMSCINLATVRSLEQQWGYAIDPLRFRANFYIDGGQAWEEFDWIGRELTLGGASFRVDRRNGRCGATNVNPVTAERDLDLPGSLRKTFGHKDLGVYLVARSHGEVRVGNDVHVPQGAAGIENEPVQQNAFDPGLGRYICRGCYYIYDQVRGAPSLPPGTAFTSIGSDWRCPDCGTDKTSFKPYE